MKTTFIYGLTDPRTGEIRYVGKSDNPGRRLRAHVQTCRRMASYSAKFIIHLVNQGLEPGLVILEEVQFERWQEAERSWIARLRAEGARLTNITDGGECGPCDEQTRAKISEVKKGKPTPWLVTPEAIARSAAARTGKKRKPCSEARRRKMIQAHLDGRYSGRFTDEHRAKISAAKVGKPRPPSVGEAVRAANLRRTVSEESRAAMTERNRKRYADPAARAKQAEAAKAAWVKRKAAKLDQLSHLQE